MKPILLAALLAFFSTVAMSVEAIVEIRWDDLKIQEPFDDPFANLTPDQLSYLSIVYRFRTMRTELGFLPDTSQARLDEALAKLTQAGVKVDEMLAQREGVAKIRQQRAVATNKALNNKDIRIPGYLLPLEYADNKKITEFLLVPFFGACIHTPPPPPNQIIHVKSKQGFKSAGLFQPVMVEGKLQSQQGTASLFYMDGVSEIPVSYVISAQEVKLYQQAP
jgi:hypothetical protein